MMKTKGKIIRQPGQGPGILMIEGQQFRFQRETVWRSEVAPRAGQAVEVELDRELQVIAVSVITELQVSAQVGQHSIDGHRDEGSTRGILGRLYAKLLGRDGKQKRFYE
jgi:hypothetical protein